MRVRFFSRYPLAEVLVDGRPAATGPLRGSVEARFANTRRLSFSSRGELSLGRPGGRPPSGRSQAAAGAGVTLFSLDLARR